MGTWLLSLTLLVSCMTPPLPNVDEDQEESPTEVIRPLSNDLTIGYYRTLLPVVSSPTRGLVYSHLANRHDIAEFELSLMRASTSFFDLETYYFQEGQHLARDFVSALLRPERPEADEDDIGQNPSIGTTATIDNETVESTAENPLIFLSYLIEQNYLTKNESGEPVLAGVSIGLALNPHHIIINPDYGFTQNLRLSDGEILTIGERMAADLLEIIREQEGLAAVPIMLGLYILEARDEVVPGRLAAKTLVAAGSSSINNWEAVEERHFLLPNSGVLEFDSNLLDEYNHFENTLSEFYPHIYGMIGMAHFIDRQLYNLEITINTEFYGLAEKLSFHQLAGELVSGFSENYNITIHIRSQRGAVGVILRPPNEDVIVRTISW